MRGTSTSTNLIIENVVILQHVLLLVFIPVVPFKRKIGDEALVLGVKFLQQTLWIRRLQLNHELFLILLGIVARKMIQGRVDALVS